MKTPTYILALTPDQPNRVKRLFEFGEGMPNKVLEEPGAFRYAGWNMETRDQAHIVEGKCVELNNGDRKKLRLYEDGTFAVTGAIDSNFLAWGDRTPEEAVRIHALAIIEFTTAFVYLYQRLMPYLENAPANLAFHVEITSGKVNNQYLRIVPYAINTYGFMFRDDAGFLTEENPTHTGIITANDVLTDPDRAAYEIVRRLFLFFSIAENKIPYTVDKDGVRRIDVGKIKTIT